MLRVPLSEVSPHATFHNLLLVWLMTSSSLCSLDFIDGRSMDRWHFDMYSMLACVLVCSSEGPVLRSLNEALLLAGGPPPPSLERIVRVVLLDDACPVARHLCLILYMHGH